MRSRAGLIVVLATIFLACRNPNSQAEGKYREALTLFRDGEFAKAGASAHAGGRKPRASEWYWRFRLLEAEALIEQTKPSDGLALLTDTQSEAPPEFEIRRRSLSARILINASKFEQADALLLEAGALAEQHSRPDLEPEIDLIAARSLAIRKRLPEAEAAVAKASRLARNSGDPFMMGLSKNILGGVRIADSRYDEAIELFDQAQQIWRSQGAHFWMAVAGNNLAACYNKLGDFEKALSYLQENQHTLHPGKLLALTLTEMGTAYLDQRDDRKAIAYYRQALEMARQFGASGDAARSAGNLTAALAETGDWDGAEQALKEAIALGPEPRSRAYLDLDDAAITQGRNRLDDARSIYGRILASKASDASVKWRAYAGIADTWTKENNAERADQNFEAAIHVIEGSQSDLSGNQNKITFLASLIRFYQDYVDALMTQNQPLQALAVADSSRARVLSQRIDHNLTGVTPGKAAEFSMIARRSGSVWMSYWLAPRRSFLWVTTPKETSVFVLPSSDEITKSVDEYRGFIETSLRDPLVARSEAGRRLYEMLIVPAASKLADQPRVILVPDGSLHQLSFETLPVYGGDKPHYWMDDATVAIAPSFGVFHGGGKTGPSQKALIIGNPVSPGPSFPALPYAAEEIAGVSQHLSAPGQRIVTGADARPDAWPKIKPGDFDIIHIAAHAEANPRSPLDSAVILSPGGGFRLYARDIIDIPLHADLVTLSACRGSGARTYAGEGQVGLTWAFLQAGSRSVVAGLWDVSDESTSMLMDRFYAGIAAGTTPAEALQTARLVLRKTAYSKPYYWGAFQCYLR